MSGKVAKNCSMIHGFGKSISASFSSTKEQKALGYFPCIKIITAPPNNRKTWLSSNKTATASSEDPALKLAPKYNPPQIFLSTELQWEERMSEASESSVQGLSVALKVSAEASWQTECKQKELLMGVSLFRVKVREKCYPTGGLIELKKENSKISG
ncbi:hypothetical protein SUGI_1160620 [Cryptomeria japonica]|nr:hypothetical protein SUGI_1160620 [Cryptomeria japonica]